MVLISVVVPVYNVEPYLQECIKSVLNQENAKFELILVDDGSTDGSGNICDKYALLDKRVKVYHKENGGLPSARNYGIDKANGEYIIFLDSDDYWFDKKTLFHLVSVAEKNKVDTVRGEYKEFIDGDICNKTEEFIEPTNFSILNNEELLAESRNKGYFVWLYLFRIELIKDIKFDENQKFQEDIEFSIRLFLNDFKGVVIPFRFYAYRKRSSSLTTSCNTKHLYYSFLLSRKFGDYSKIVKTDYLRELYIKSSVEIYNATMETLVSTPYYKMSSRLIKEFQLNDLQKTIKKLARMLKGKSFPIITYCKPSLGVFILRYYVVTRSFFLYCGSTTKKYINNYIK